MSVVRTRNFTVVYRWDFIVIPWYRQLLALVFGLGVMLIALWGIDQGQGPLLIASVVGMAFLSLLLIFGIEVDSVRIGDKIEIDFTSTSVTESATERRDERDDE